ncbi:7SK snRNA methylphosphate capping enzyme bin3-like isoform X2 [Anopheles albimanus]|uniref:RNA methyltransferase n=2 Tax=Anopheles albimanus TaxID=7167 RepID=A0A182FTW9_ANOAL|nr:7SK snRNA methylphosphate capping enzyme bin3-like isoform X2 [Anopheles albimanus]XP_035794292.1 7SK snRNA methylphosphate capping enzyme bin3-like isoform X2 [Anopheles albimanus]
METGLSVASADDDSAADGGGGTGPGGDVLPRSRSSVPAEETRRCNAHRAARPPNGRSPRGAPLAVLPIAAVGAVGASVIGGGHNRQKKQKQRQQQQLQQQQQPPQHTGGKKQKKQQKWKSNKYRGVAKGGRKDKASATGGQSEDGSVMANNGIAVDDSVGPAGSKQSSTGDNPQQKTFSEMGQQQQQQQQNTSMVTATAASQAQTTTTVQGQEGTKGSTSQQQQQQQQKGKHSKQQNLSPMGLRNKRLQCASKYFLPDKRPRKDCIVPPTKFLLGGNISDPLNLNSLQNESENAVTPKSSPIPTPPHYKAKIEVIIPPNINDPLHLLDPVDSVEYEMQLCSPMKRKQRPRNKRKRKSRAAGTERSLSEASGAAAAAVGAGAASSSMLLIEQLPPPGTEQAEGPGTAGGVLVAAAGGGVEATTAEEASFTGIGQKLSEAINTESYPACSSAQQTRNTLLLAQGLNMVTGASTGTTSSVVASVSANVGGGSSTSNMLPSVTAPTSDQAVDREREKAMRNLKLDLEASGGRKRRTSESTNSTKNKVRRMDSMDKIVSPVIPQPGGWKRGHWPAGHTGSGGAAGGERGRNRTRTYSQTSNADDETGATEREATECPVQERLSLQSEHPSADASLGQVGESVASGVAEGRLQNNQHDRAASCESRATSTCEGSTDAGTGLSFQAVAEGERTELDPNRVIDNTIETVPRIITATLPASSRYHHGNYDRYYGYHSLNEFIDVRLKVFLRNPYLFREKDVLDIGCNVGLMTIAVAKMLQTKSATGIDVDGKLIAKARKNLANYVRVPRKLPTAMSSAKRRSGATATDTRATNSIKDEVPKAMLELEAQHSSEVKVENEATAVEEVEAKQRRLSTGESISTTNSTNVISVVEETITSHESGSINTAVASAMVVEDAASDVGTVNQPHIVPATSADDGDEDAVQSGGVEPNAHSSAEEPENDRNNPKSERQQEIAELLSKLKQKRRRKRFPPRQGGRHQHHHHHHNQHHHHHHHHQHNQNQHGKQSGGGGGHQHHAGGRNKTEQTQFFPISFPLTMGNLSGKEYQMDIGHPEHKFPHNVRFKTMNYVLKEESLINYDTQQYDLILCLSVTKWIHLNYGDAGLKIAFKRMFNHLRPGGKLILEAQNWASYKKKKKLTETIFENYKNIEFFPCRFHDYLLSPEVGFSHSYPLGIPRHLSKGFRRPIQLYIKGDFTPSQAKWSDTYHPATPYENHRGIYTDIVTASQTAAGCIWGAMTPYAPSYSYRQPPTPSHSSGANGGNGSGGGGASGSGNGFASTSPYYNPRQTDSYLPSYDNYGNGYRPGSYCFASPLYSTTWSPPSDMLATSGGGGGSYRRSASNTPNSASIRSTDNDEHYYAGTVGGSSQRRHHVYPPIDVFQPLLGQEHMRLSAGFRGGNGGGGGGGAMTDSDSELSSNSASQTPTRQQQLAGSFLIDDQSNSPSGNSQPDK